MSRARQTQTRVPLPRIPAWLEARLRKSVTDSHFEASVYGPLNGVLNIFFPIAQQFLVKPQGLLRVGPALFLDDEVVPADVLANVNLDETDDQDAGNTSMDSYGDPVYSEIGIKRSGIPDFIIAKAGLGDHPDTVLGIVEVKGCDASGDVGRLQLCGYLYKAYTKNKSAVMAGFLVRGTTVEIYEIDPEAVLIIENSPTLEFSTWEPQRTYPIGSILFREYIHGIATRHWEIQ